MKNLSLILNVVLLIAVAVLFYLHFSVRSEVQTVEGSVASSDGLHTKTVIAYVNTDTLAKNYDFIKDMQEELKVLNEKYNNEYTNRARGLENEIRTFQQTAGNMTMGQAKAREEELMRKQNNLMQYQQSLAQRLMQEEARYGDSLSTLLRDYVKVYGKENNLDVVLALERGSNVIYANDTLDITQDVVVGLNDLYRKQKGTSEKPQPAKAEKK